MTTGVSTIDNLAALEQAYKENKVAPNDREFVASLIDKAKAGKLKERGWYWVGVMATRATGRQPTAVVGDFSGVYALFQRAKQHLKHPKVRLQSEDGLPLQLYLAGQRSRYPNVVNVTNGQPYGSDDSKWYGRVTPEGQWQQNDRLPPDQLRPVAALLRKLAKDPAGVAAEYGRLTGLCCFCYRPLSDERSTAVGYGPQCAERYGLSWGSTERAGANPIREENAVGRRVRVRRAVSV